MIEWLTNIDEKLFFILNGAYTSFLDQPMFWISNKYIWIPMYAVFLWMLIKNYRWNTLYLLLFIAILITLSDQGSTHLFKNVFQRLRPCHDPGIMDMVHTVNNKCGGRFGFISSHASNSFSLAVFLSGWLRKSYRWFPWLIFTWAALVSYSRIYLGVHFPGDVVAGAVFGGVLGYLVLFISRKVIKARF